MLPFTVDEFFAVFVRYNEAVWPAQWALYGIGVAVVVLAWSSADNKNRWICGLLGVLWIWMGIAYHVAQFSRINPLAYVFAVAFLLEGALFVWWGVRREAPSFSLRRGPKWLGALLIAYALAGYPALSAALGHRYPATPTFGVPCPTTIFTLGMLCLAAGPGTRALLVVPVLWAAIGGSAAFLLDVPQDLGLIAAAVFVLAAATLRSVSRRRG